MWYLKFKLKHNDCIFAPLAEKYNLQIEFFPMQYYRKGNWIYTPAIHIAHGKENNIKKYLSALKKNKRIVKIEISKVIFTLTKEKAEEGHYETIYNPEIIFITPGYNTSDGYEAWEIASWNRNALEKLIKTMEHAKNVTHFEIQKFTEHDLNEVFILQLFPTLPKKQKQSIELAYKEGYYSYPKRTNLDKLAKIAKISKQTFQENLRKAESRLMPLLLRT